MRCTPIAYKQVSLSVPREALKVEALLKIAKARSWFLARARSARLVHVPSGITPSASRG